MEEPASARGGQGEARATPSAVAPARIERGSNQLANLAEESGEERAATPASNISANQGGSLHKAACCVMDGVEKPPLWARWHLYSGLAPAALAAIWLASQPLPACWSINFCDSC